MELDMVADMEVDKVADMVADIDINIEIQFVERVAHGGWLIGPKLCRPKLTRLAHLLSFASLLYLISLHFRNFWTNWLDCDLGHGEPGLVLAPPAPSYPAPH